MHNLCSRFKKLELRLRESGMEASYVTRAIQELTEHWEDLKRERESEGFTEEEAGAYATARLGGLEHLERSLKDKKRQSSWVGRHPAITFGLFPFVAIFLWWAVCLPLEGWASGLTAWGKNRELAEPLWESMRFSMQLTSIGSGIILPIIFCSLSRLYASFSGAFLGCLCVGIHNFFHLVQLTSPSLGGKGSFTWGYHVTPSVFDLSLPGLALPLLVFAFFVLSNRVQTHVTLKQQ